MTTGVALPYRRHGVAKQRLSVAMRDLIGIRTNERAEHARACTLRHSLITPLNLLAIN